MSKDAQSTALDGVRAAYGKAWDAVNAVGYRPDLDTEDGRILWELMAELRQSLALLAYGE